MSELTIEDHKRHGEIALKNIKREIFYYRRIGDWPMAARGVVFYRETSRMISANIQAIYVKEN